MSNQKSSGSRQAQLVLADGTRFSGVAFGASCDATKPAVGEVVFNTSLYGYQEILSDPSYTGQIMTFTAPQIGNVGTNSEDVESDAIAVSGVIVRELSPVVSNFRSEQSFDSYLAKNRCIGIAGIDTRALVTHLRTHGSQMGAIAEYSETERSEPVCDALAAAAKAAGSMVGKDYVTQVSCRTPYQWNGTPWILGSGYSEISEVQRRSRPHVVAIDCGIKQNILRLLVDSGFAVTVVPVTHTSAQIKALSPDALFLSNGPGDPATLGFLVKTTRELLGQLPIFGICLGHQILGQAVGGKTYKLKFGHRGGNHPVKDLLTGKVEITVQNHGFAVDHTSLPREVFVSHTNLNDGTVEGLSIPELNAFSVQYHPEASPGPRDSRYLFDRFFDSVTSRSSKSSSSAVRTPAQQVVANL